jgi:hypothetical protein
MLAGLLLVLLGGYGCYALRCEHSIIANQENELTSQDYSFVQACKNLNPFSGHGELILT